MHVCYLEKEFVLSPTPLLIELLDLNGIKEGSFIAYVEWDGAQYCGFSARAFICDNQGENGMPMCGPYYAPVEMWKDYTHNVIGECICGHREEVVGTNGKFTFSHIADDVAIEDCGLICFDRKDGAQ
jgi:hypothetical protein